MLRKSGANYPQPRLKNGREVLNKKNQKKQQQQQKKRLISQKVLNIVY